MLSSRAARPHVCLRCRIFLEKRRLSPFVQTVQISDEASRSSKKEIDNDEKNPVKGELHLRGNHIGVPESESKEHVQRKKMKSNIIILPESQLAMWKRDKPVVPIDVTPIDIIDQLSNECIPADSSEVNRNIDDLRPKEEQIDSWTQFNQLLNKLTDGFTSLQLQQYIKSFELDTKVEYKQEPIKSNSGEFLSSITPWRPGISSYHKYFDNDRSRGYLLESLSPKQRLAIQIMRNFWNIELLPLDEGIGQFEILIRNDVLELLLSGNPSHLQTLYDDVLIMEDEALEVFRSRNVIRITTTKNRKYRILLEIEKLVGMTKIRKILPGDLIPVPDVKLQPKIDLDQWTRKIFNDQTLKELKRMTGVAIRREAHGIICISALTKKAQFQEDPIDAARRLLLTARPTATQSDYSLASSDRSLAAPIMYCQLEGLNWWCRARSWFRWTDPIPKEAQTFRPVSTAETSFINYVNPSDGRMKKESSLKLLMRPELGDETVSKNQWSTKPSISTFASLGAVIHTSSDPESKEIPSINSDPKDFITEFSPQLPNITRFLSNAKIEKTRTYDEKLILRFLPNPFFKLKDKPSKRKSISAKILSALPAVEFNCLIDRGKKAHFSHAEAIVHENFTDIMLPQEVVDVRFRQRFSNRLLNSKMPVIRNFLRDCRLNTERGGKLYVGPSIMLPISSHLCKGKGLKHFLTAQYSDEGDANSSNSLNQNVEYLFSGLEIRRRLVFKYEDWHLEYIYIDAGKSGRTRGELSLRPIKNGKGVSDQEFIDYSLELACHLTSLSTPDMTRFNEITKIKNPLVRKYVPVHQPASDYPRSYLYIPKRILPDSLPEEEISKDDSSLDLLPDFEEEIRAFEDEIDETAYDEDFNPLDELENSIFGQHKGPAPAVESPDIGEKNP